MLATMEVWVLPLPFFSHVVCCSQLAEQIARQGVTVTLFLSKTDVALLSKPFIEKQQMWKLQGASIAVQELDCESVVLADSVGGIARFVEPFKVTEHLFEQKLKQAVDSGLRPTCVITDMLLPRAGEAVSKYGIPSWRFISLSASSAISIIHINHLISQGILNLPTSGREKVARENVISLPGVPLIRVCDLLEGMFKDQPLSYELRLATRVTIQADAVLLSSFQDLEPRGVHHLEKLLQSYGLQCFGKAPKVWTIGPTFSNVDQKPSHSKNENRDNLNPCISFLDSQPASSVVYVSFGTEVNISHQQLLELVHGLEKTGHPFICAVHPQKETPESTTQTGADVPNLLPSDCAERITKKSVFVDWAPQLQILSHPSTGAFISHCGQNSLMESLTAGVPILAWPWQYDQFINCRVLVEDTQVALEIRPGLFSGGLVDREDIAKCVHNLFHSPQGAAVRDRALTMKHNARKSVQEHGSCMRNLKDLVSVLDELRNTTRPE